MIRRLLMTIVFFIVLAGAAYAVPITYYYSGTFGHMSCYGIEEWPTIRSGDTFTGTFSYNSSDFSENTIFNTPPDIYPGTSISFTVENDTIFKDNFWFQINSNQTIFIEEVPSGILDGMLPNHTSLLSMWLYGDTGLPGSVVLNILSGGNHCYAQGGINYLSTVNPNPEPVPEPATMFLLGTGLIGMAGVMQKKIKRS